MHMRLSFALAKKGCAVTCKIVPLMSFISSFPTHLLLYQSTQNQPMHRGAFCQFTFRWIYHCHSSSLLERKQAKRTSVQCNDFRGVVPGGAMAPQDFDRSITPILIRGERLCPPNYYWYPRIFTPSDGPGFLKLNYSLMEV